MSSDAWFHRVKAAQRDLIKLVGGIDRAAEISSVSPSHIGRMNNARDTDLMPLSVVYALENDCGVPVVTQAMAELCGRRLTDPEIEQQANINVLTSYSNVLQKAAALMASGAAAMADAFVTPAEAHSMDRHASDIERDLSQFRQALAVVKATGGAKAGLHIVGSDT
ncbi:MULTISPECIES: hypothetical protein [unclassified Rhizobium]|uniref:hypothetical protein n=1 Tax=unclassified Rhizobium TaxID=2613769 RepID=UPI00161EB282|nr:MULTISPECIES: hypothetical protein [unclassified Rhizobium]MBB3288178.1 hypothetical protein [Rhizobium sp. BK252]MBB3402958.1 hypothetical protein [Rhizobium sp. BK289]MBB3415535.1 hypothetical protein [Rhizobium sp. BK284]MBB3483384.1 hypothetical protein [Rhizobium sp. BK347]